MMDEIVSRSQYGGGGKPVMVSAFSQGAERRTSLRRSLRLEGNHRNQIGFNHGTSSGHRRISKSNFETEARLHRSPVGPDINDMFEGHKEYAEYVRSPGKQIGRPPLTSSPRSPRRSSLNRTRSADVLPTPNLQQSSRTEGHRKVRPSQHHKAARRPLTMIEISPGHMAPLRSAQDTQDYIHKNQVTEATCFACSVALFCVQDASYVLCPGCKVVSPLLIKAPVNQDGSVGMGFSFETYTEILSSSEHLLADNAPQTFSPRQLESHTSALQAIEGTEVVEVSPDSFASNYEPKPAKKIASGVSLYDIFPAHIAEALSEGRKVEAEQHNEVTIFFSDIVSFTSISAELPPRKVADLLDRFYLKLDELSTKYDVFKVETIGDGYLACTNLVKDQSEDHAKRITKFAIEAVKAASETRIDPDDESIGVISIRVGIHSGPVVSDVIGRRNPRYCLFGDTVNTASRIETTSKKNAIHCSDASASILKLQWPSLKLYPRGPIPLKGKGVMHTFWVNENPGKDETETPLNIPITV